MDPLAQLFERYRDDGDLRALAAVFDALAPRLLSVALHLAGREADAEDLVAQTFLLAIERAAKFDASRRLEPWLAGMLTNLARNARRAGRRRDAAGIAERTDETADPAVAAERRELVAQLRTHIDALPVEQRQVLLLQLQHGLGPAAIAEVLGVPAGTVRMRLHRGLRALRRALPAGLAVLGSLGTATRGLAAVRADVLRRAALRIVSGGALAAASTTAATATVAGGSLVAKKMLLGAVALLGCGLVCWRLSDPAAPPEPSSPPAALAEPAVATVARPGDTETPAAAEREVAAADARGALRVRVLAAVGDERLPTQGMLVELWEGASALPPLASDRMRSVRTDAGGEVRFADLSPGTWQVRLPSLREADPVATEVAPQGESRLDLVQTAERVARGIVVDGADAPVAGAEVWIHRGTWLGRYGIVDADELVARRAGVTDRQGRFTVPVFGFESVIGANHPLHAASRGRYLANGHDDLRLVLGPGAASLAVTVRTADGATVPGALVRLDPVATSSRRAADGTLLARRVTRLARTDAAGVAAFAGVPPGRNRVSAIVWPWTPAARELEVASSARAEVALELGEGVTIVGRVRHADGSPARASVRTRPHPDDPGHWCHCDTREDGSFVLGHQPRRTLWVVALVGRQQIVARREIVDPPASTTYCELVIEDGAMLRGRVVSEGGTPLAFWTVTAHDGNGGEWKASSGRDGQFGVAVTPGGLWTWSATAPGSGTPATTVGSCDGRTPIELRVPEAALPSASLRGRLLAADGMPVGGHRLSLAWQGAHERKVQTSADGTFALDALFAGGCTLSHWRGGTAIPLREIDLAHAQRLDLGDLVLPATAMLQIELLHADGRPWRGHPPGIALRRADGSSAVVEQTSGGDGGVQITTDPGAYRVELQATDLLAPDLAVTLAAGANAPVQLPLGIGRSFTLQFRAPGEERSGRAPMRAVVRGSDGATVLQRAVRFRQSMPGGYGASLHATLPFGRYEVEASDEVGRGYRGAFELVADPEVPTEIEVPAVP